MIVHAGVESRESRGGVGKWYLQVRVSNFIFIFICVVSQPQYRAYPHPHPHPHSPPPTLHSFSLLLCLWHRLGESSCQSSRVRVPRDCRLRVAVSIYVFVYVFVYS